VPWLCRSNSLNNGKNQRGTGIPHREALFELGWLWEEIEELGEKLAVAEESAREEEVVPA